MIHDETAVHYGYGILGISGIVAFVLAAVMLFEGDTPGFGVSWPVTAVLSAGLMIFLLGFIWRAHRRPVTTGASALIGREVEVMEWSGDKGYV